MKTKRSLRFFSAILCFLITLSTPCLFAFRSEAAGGDRTIGAVYCNFGEIPYDGMAKGDLDVICDETHYNFKARYLYGDFVNNKFVGGNTYRLELSLIAYKGYVFDDPLSAYLSGSAGVVKNRGDDNGFKTILIAFEFRVPEPKNVASVKVSVSGGLPHAGEKMDG